MNTSELPTRQIEQYSDTWFKQECLRAFRDQLAQRSYPGYPSFNERFFIDSEELLMEPMHLPDGPWETSEGALSSIREQYALADKVDRFDQWGRPLHPWFEDMAEDPAIGIVTGKGFYWNWGPNYTADAIVIRHDLEEDHVLLIQRADTGQWALPGGFIDPGESALTASIREVQEEALLNLECVRAAARQTYSGPLADLRTTAHAWPETTAFRFDLPVSTSLSLRLRYPGSDESPQVAWVPIRTIDSHVFGSHRALIDQAINAL